MLLDSGKAWIAKYGEECEKDQSSELSALGFLLQKFGSLELLKLKLSKAEEKLENPSQEISNALFSLNVDGMNLIQLREIVKTLQVEVRAFHTYMQNCNILSNKLMKAAQSSAESELERLVFSTENSGSHLQDLIVLNVIQSANFGPLEYPTSLLVPMEMEAQADFESLHQEISSANNRLRSIEKRYVGNQKTPEKLVTPGCNVSTTHPASWAGKMDVGQINGNCFSSEVESVSREINRLKKKFAAVGKHLETVIADKDSTISMQRNIEKGLISSKRESNYASLQLASVVMRMIYHVFPKLWEKLAHSSNFEKISPDDALEWEGKNGEWLKNWISTVNSTEGDKSSGFENSVCSTKDFLSIFAMPNLTDQKKGGRSTLLPIAQLVAKRYNLSSERENSSAVLDACVDFAIDVAIIPNLISQHLAGSCFGAAERNVRFVQALGEIGTKTTVDDGSCQSKDLVINTITLISEWLKECALCAFGNRDKSLSRCLKVLANHIQSELHRQKKTVEICSKEAYPPKTTLFVSPRPQTAGSTTRPTMSNSPARSLSPRKRIVHTKPTQNVPCSKEDELLYGIFVYFGMRSRPQTATITSPFDEISKCSEFLSRTGLFRFLAEYRFIPELMTKDDVLKLLNETRSGGTQSYDQFKSFVRSVSQLGNVKCKLREEPFSSLAGAAAEKKFGIEDVSVEYLSLLVAIDYVTNSTVRTNGKTMFQLRQRLLSTNSAAAGENPFPEQRVSTGGDIVTFQRASGLISALRRIRQEKRTRDNS